MNARYTLIVVLVFVALVAFAYTLRDTESRQVGPGAPTATPQALLEVNEADVEEVSVLGATGAYTLSRVAGGWEVDGQPASTEVGSVVTALAKPTVLRELPADRKAEDYGFATPALTVTLRTAAGDKHVIVVGDKAVAEEQRYVKLLDGARIVLIGNYDIDRLVQWLTSPPLAPTATPTGDLTPAAAGEATTEGLSPAEESTAEETAEATATAPPEATSANPQAPTRAATLPAAASPTP